MEGLSGLLGFITWVGSIMVLIQMFKKKGILHAILGLIIPLYPFIWGIKHWGDPEYNVKTGMIVWLVVGVLAQIVNVIMMSSGG